MAALCTRYAFSRRPPCPFLVLFRFCMLVRVFVCVVDIDYFVVDAVVGWRRVGVVDTSHAVASQNA